MKERNKVIADFDVRKREPGDRWGGVWGDR